MCCKNNKISLNSLHIYSHNHMPFTPFVCFDSFSPCLSQSLTPKISASCKTALQPIGRIFSVFKWLSLVYWFESCKCYHTNTKKSSICKYGGFLVNNCGTVGCENCYTKSNILNKQLHHLSSLLPNKTLVAFGNVNGFSSESK